MGQDQRVGKLYQEHRLKYIAWALDEHATVSETYNNIHSAGVEGIEPRKLTKFMIIVNLVLFLLR